ncbi:hypothetical protein Rfer_4440 (plasmid) [Rhodoferax ferrireducens T118]|uniref:Uncharacterized protein n=1 Tax=Albidiferax ferrireducens (strain ATCC BAA-621 / DSM 15236 / T118) TaxID=338969 RepID=Q21Q19_ALBFT|nr:hypothetical protein [Rhodoferax ferrireducens]ABD72126.1 hypothetical protein Rfer_4440 [Rhodoferax ferrireducens T118]
MKIRNFYPRQVLRKLQGENKQFDAGQLAAIKYPERKGRKLSLSIVVGMPKSAVDVIKSISQETAQAMIANANTFILLKHNARAMTSGHLGMTTVNAADLPVAAL